MSKNTPHTKSQIDKFEEVARKLGADESEERFDETLKRVGKAKITHAPKTKKQPGSEKT